ncbi:ornithine cyclodeaminase family protein [Pseudohoeflea coraliihabitans]|uniref:Ornithine cyclodeaminase n=1 Tax=Pseudohoeflea coraliihabitans TaxID=2860393 RepID=A0ABS6WPN0_9HYPH|nr:ornithine cyclodeaminase [Pseudohoeflea sp. DP4N28-3]MBW3097913.1 ornithine cyclodeaminase [Pseudohoeflea sp. DP4N28-3]
MQIITGADVARVCTWPMIVAALREGHQRDPALLRDSLLEDGHRKMLVRSAWIPGLASGTKAVTIYPDNPSNVPARPSVQGQVLLFDEKAGFVRAVIEGVDLTGWKTAGDSALGADCLARSDIATMLMVGAGSMAAPLIAAHRSVRPSIERVIVWNRSRARGEALVADLTSRGIAASYTSELDAAVPEADLICTATMSEEPLLRGALIAPGTHVDLVGAYTPTMREADDEALRRGRLFVDSFETTIGHIGEVSDPLQRGVIARSDLEGDLHALVQGRAGRRTEEEITLFKNGGGAHLDIMVANAVANALSE